MGGVLQQTCADKWSKEEKRPTTGGNSERRMGKEQMCSFVRVINMSRKRRGWLKGTDNCKEKCVCRQEVGRNHSVATGGRQTQEKKKTNKALHDREGGREKENKVEREELREQGEK